MTGKVSMIRLIALLFLLSSCGNLPIAYISNFSSVNNVVFGFPEYEITQDIFDNYENSFMKIRFGRGPHAILILAYVDGDIYEWVGADDVSIFTRKGRIIKTIGLPHNFELIKYRDEVLPSLKFSYELVNLYNPDLYSAMMKESFASKKASIKKLEKTVTVTRIKEKFNIDQIGWRGANYYYQNLETLEIERAEQNIHPKLPTVRIEYYLKY
jgi:hypothetical protein